MEQRAFNIYPLGLGSIIGFMCGNAAGSYLTGINEPTEEQINKALELSGGGRAELGPGQVSDESELLMCLLYALSESRGVLDINCIIKYYTKWAGLERLRKSLL
jgi:ADP-ribosylglycohydrolase